jgi:hypothetical protein
MNMASLAMSLAGLLIWLFFSPHRHAEQGQIRKIALDRTRKHPSPSCGHRPILSTQRTIESSFYQSPSWQFFWIPILGVPAHQCFRNCDDLHDIENCSPHRFLDIHGGIVGHQLAR